MFSDLSTLLHLPAVSKLQTENNLSRNATFLNKSIGSGLNCVSDVLKRNWLKFICLWYGLLLNSNISDMDDLGVGGYGDLLMLRLCSS